MTIKTNKPDIKDITAQELEMHLNAWGVAPYRTGQILRWIYQRQADRFSDMSDLKKEFRDRLADTFSIHRFNIADRAVSKDGSMKYLFELADGELIESVLIPERNHFTLCISSQAGCAQRCRFCATATNGFSRNLTRGEIVGQVRDVRNFMTEPRKLTNIVFMGMGEPLANYRPVVSAVQTLIDSNNGFGFSTRRITLSTAGLAPKIPVLGRDTDINLAVSLNAVDNAMRDQLMPVNQTYPIEELLEACRTFPMGHRRRITIEYILIKGLNDSPSHAEKLAGLLHGIKAKVNLILFNPYPGCAYERPDPAAAEAFWRVLHKKRYTTVIRRSKGRDIAAACGQLRAVKTDNNRAGFPGDGRNR